MRRSLVLAGGGMRVAWQTGVVQALTEHELSFDHVDGTSGGIMTTGMLLSGLEPRDMAARWADLDVRDFTSALPLTDYLRGPWALPAAGDADGLLQKVFPHLGIDCATIRESSVEGTFNVVDFVTKSCVAVPNTDVDPELLAAGMSLPLAMPPLRRDGRVWTDAVWVKDANVTEALRRGADEVWLVWCIGNSPYWGDGPLEQYVHMIEMSANGALFAELDAARRAGRGLPAARRAATAPAAAGHRALRRADQCRDPGRHRLPRRLGVPRRDGAGRSAARRHLHRDDRAAARRPADGAAARPARDEDLTLSVTAELALEKRPTGPTRVVGHVDHDPWGGRVPLADGRVEVDGAEVVHRGRARVGGRWLELAARRELTDDEGLDAWADVGTVELRTGDGTETTLRLGPLDAARALASVEPVGAHGALDRAGALARLGRTGLRRVLTTYGS